MTEAHHSRSIERLADQLEKPLLDDRTYRVIKLPNQLEVLLIHDPDTDKASAAMDVNVGSFSDSEEMPGMAHAVEHLLFMGTEKYPGENEYNTYLTKYGGYSNAFTAATSTNYFFELSASKTSNSPSTSANSSKASLPIDKSDAPLYRALDRFSQFFVNPLFLEDTLDRELRAVDSENKKNLQSDSWRFHQLDRSLSSKKHPFHLFSTGNYKVLHDDPIGRGIKIRDAFIGFYKKHYSANRMKLVVLGRESLDELEGWTQEFFSAVPNQNLPKLRWDGIPAYDKEELCTQIFAKPVMDTRMLDLHFPYPDEDLWYESQPGRYISHLIGHEGPGSILAYIKAKGWANSLSSGPGPVCPGTAFFSISIRLTPEGLNNFQEIFRIIFQYIAMLKDEPPHEWIVDEMAKLQEVDFKFRQKTAASRATSRLSGVMQKPLPRDQLLSGPSLIRKFNPDAIKTGLAALRPDNFRMTIVSQEYPGEWPEKEQWYGTEYKYEKIPQGFMKQLEATVSEPASQRPPELHLPGVNEFVPQRLEVEKKDVKEPLIAPKLIRSDENVRTWFKKDDRFWVPKANIEVCLRSPLVNVSPLAAVMTQIFKELVDDSLNEYSYDAELAGLEYSINSHSQGLDVTVSGYNDKMPVLLEKVLLSMRDLEVKEDRYQIVKERMLRGYRNFGFSEPFRQISTYSRWLISDRGWVVDQLLAELPSVTAADVRAFFPQILKQMHIELLIHGNLYKEDALHITNLIEKTLNPHRLPPSQWPTKRSILLPPGSNFVYPRELENKDNVNHCIETLLFVGSNLDRPLRAKLLLLAQMTNEPCFDQLRTKEQLGYVVASGALVFGTVNGFRVLIQSERDCEYLDKRIDSFLSSFARELEGMAEEEFEAHKVSLINTRLEKLKNLEQETGRLWNHVTSEVYDFELVHHDVANIEPLTRQEMTHFYNHYILPGSPTRAKASVHLVAQASAEDIAAKTDPLEQRERLTALLAQVLGQLGLEVDNTTLSQRLEKVDVSGGDTDDILAAVGAYLKENGGMVEDQIQQVVQQGEVVLAQVLPQLGIKSKATVEGSEEVVANGEGQIGEVSKAVVIEDVKGWKASMPVSAGARAVKDLSEFEEMEPKL